MSQRFFANVVPWLPPSRPESPNRQISSKGERPAAIPDTSANVAQVDNRRGSGDVSTRELVRMLNVRLQRGDVMVEEEECPPAYGSRRGEGED
jgi:hypothetical protein